MLGLLAAVSAYVDRDEDAERRRSSAIVDRLLAGFAGCGTPRRLSDEAGRGIDRAGIVLDPAQAAEFVEYLRTGTPPIHPRTHLVSTGIVAFDPRPLHEDDIDVVIERVRSFFAN
jgi:D-glucosaminate-6-phosphate ammonia-lyase